MLYPRSSPLASTLATILLVSKDDRLCQYLRRLLEARSYFVEESTTYQQTLALIESNHPDLVIMHFIMPDMEGIEAVVALRKEGRDVPMINISGGSLGVGRYFISAADQSGFGKPHLQSFSEQNLFALIEKLLRTETKL